MKVLSHDEADRLLKAAAKGRTAVVEDVALPDFYQWPVRSMQNVTFRDIAMRCVALEGGWLGAVVVSGCRFERVDFGASNVRKFSWTGCTFEECCFGDPDLGHIKHGIIANCRFNSCRLLHERLADLEIADTTFTNIFTKKSMWSHCRMKNISFSGQLVSTNFCDCDYDTVDFATATFADSSFVGDGHNDRIMPDSAENFVIHGSILAATMERVAARLSRAGRKEYARLSRVFSRTDEEVIDPGFLCDMPEADRLRVLRDLYAHRMDVPLKSGIKRSQ